MATTFKASIKKLAQKGYDPAYQTEQGCLYQGDCLQWLKAVPDNTVHTIFADPPFNLGKNYGRNISDNLKEEEYIAWSHGWLDECVRILVTGGALFVFNLPKWLIPYGAFLNQRSMLFRHWIACRDAQSLSPW